MYNIFDNAAIFLIHTLFNLYILVVILRIIMQWAGAHFHNPVTQFIVKITNPVVKPLRRILPAIKGLDLASFLIVIILEAIKLGLILILQSGGFPNLVGLLIMAFGDILAIVINIFFYAIILAVILSWINPGTYNPLTEILHLITAPLLQPARRLIPPISGFDLSPILVLIVLQLLSMIVATPLIAIGFKMAIS